MVHQKLKDVLFYGAYFLSWPRYAVARIANCLRARKGATPALHLGCGPDYIEGMINIDGNLFRNIDLWHDLRRRLPYPDGSVHFVYSSHTLEHLYPDEALNLLTEISRILASEGRARIVVPSLEHALAIIRREASSRWPRRFNGKRAQAINYLFCDGQHKYGYSKDLIGEMSTSAGLKVHELTGPLNSERGSYQYNGYKLPSEPEGSLVVDLRRTCH